VNYLITGVAGTGKTSAAKELRRRGYDAYDTEEGFSYYIDKTTGERCAYPANPTEEWYQTHERVFDEKILNNLLKKHAADTLFISSITANQKKFYPVFDKIFLLTTDDDLISHRLKTRRGNDFGKNPLDLKRVITRHAAFDEELVDTGAVVIDASRPIDLMVDDILSHIDDDR
jgi:broad-specificity NMP kinase